MSSLNKIESFIWKNTSWNRKYNKKEKFDFFFHILPFYPPKTIKEKKGSCQSYLEIVKDSVFESFYKTFIYVMLVICNGDHTGFLTRYSSILFQIYDQGNQWLNQSKIILYQLYYYIKDTSYIKNTGINI